MDKYSSKIIPVLKQYGVSRASLFGSVARGEDTDKSDIDILIEPPKKMTLFGLAGMKLALEKALKKSVDVVTFNSLNPLLRKYVLTDEKVLYE